MKQKAWWHEDMIATSEMIITHSETFTHKSLNGTISDRKWSAKYGLTARW